MSAFFDMDGNEVSQAEWVRLVRKKKAFVRFTRGVNFDVSTRWTGTDLAGRDNNDRALIYETSVLEANSYTAVDKVFSATQEDALKTHERLLKSVLEEEY
jgi:hypothetical protein